jgi:glycosyltransferase involved in cell wall biosynthesis
MKARKIFLLFHGRFPSEKAASLFAAKNAEAFAQEGIEVIVVVPRRRGVSPHTAYDYYNVKKIFSLAEIPVVDLFGYGFDKIAFYVSYLSFSLSCLFYLRGKTGENVVVYTNEFIPLYIATFLTQNTMYEMHDFPESKLRVFGTMLKSFSRLLVHNSWKLEKLQQLFSFPVNRILCEPNAVDIVGFDILTSTREARQKLGLPEDRKIVLYTGHLYGWKGVDTLAQAAKELTQDVLVVFVGGTPADVASFKVKYGALENVRIVGHVPHKDIPLWQKAADVLVLPNTAKEAISAYYTSPMKLYEYMAARKPIIASDLPSVREVVGEKGAFLVEPDDSLALRQMITKVLSTDTAATVETAWSLVQKHTWSARAKRIISFIDE